MNEVYNQPFVGIEWGYDMGKGYGPQWDTMGCTCVQLGTQKFKVDAFSSWKPQNAHSFMARMEELQS